jgi:hypothetical protein
MPRPPALVISAIVPVPWPEAGPKVSHAAGAAAFQLKVPSPKFVMVRVCVVGLLSPCRTLKEKLDELTPITGFDGDWDGLEIGGAASCVNPGTSDMSRRRGAVDGRVCMGLGCGATAAFEAEEVEPSTEEVSCAIGLAMSPDRVVPLTCPEGSIVLRPENCEAIPLDCE